MWECRDHPSRPGHAILGKGKVCSSTFPKDFRLVPGWHKNQCASMVWQLIYSNCVEGDTTWMKTDGLWQKEVSASVEVLVTGHSTKQKQFGNNINFEQDWEVTICSN